MQAELVCDIKYIVTVEDLNVSISPNRRLERRPVDHRVKVSYRSGAKFIGVLSKMRNISMGGAFIDLPQPRLSSLNLDLVFPESCQNVVYLHQISARIVRVTPSGVALQFRDFDSRFYYCLLRLTAAD